MFSCSISLMLEAPDSENRMLIIRVITFVLSYFRSTCNAISMLRTDRQTN